MAAAAGAGAKLDGRRVRAEKSRIAIVDAFLSLLPTSTRRPTVEEIAVAAGVSERSVYRHFPEVDSLIEAAIRRRIELVAPLVVVDADPGAPLDVRVDETVAQRCRFYEAALPLRRFTDRVRHEVPALHELEQLRRVFLRDQLAELFATEIASAPGCPRVLLDALEAATSWSTWQHLREEQGCAPEAACASMNQTVRALLASVVPAVPAGVG